jgi:hypothetical protein
MNASRPFNFSNMFAALENAGVRVSKTQKRKAMQAIAKPIERTRRATKPVLRFNSAISRTAPASRVVKRISMKRTATKTNKANANGNVNMAVAVAPVSKAPRVLKAKQLGHIMHSYEEKPEKAETYAHFKRLHDLYHSKKNVYGFTGETDIQELIHTLKQQDELVQSEVDELAALFGSTGL